MDGLEEELGDLERILCGQKEPDKIDFHLLRRLTGNFSDDRRIGEGGCGEVYKGILPNGVVIAVKKLKNSHTIDEKMFRREVDSMIKVGHPNIVRFIGYCSETREKALQMDGKTVMAEERERLLCFEFIRTGSIDRHITDELRGFEWHTRYQIIKGICYGLLHLHKEKGILHMDLKPANILLNEQTVPKITDFGVSRTDGVSQTTTSAQAQRLLSPGYCAPEYIENGKRSWKSDIYSLGVIIIELVTGSRETPNATKVLRRWRHRWSKSSKHIPLWYKQVKKCLELAVRCQERDRINRPFISEIVRELNKLDSWDGEIREPSLEKIISSSDDMLGIEPLELNFPLAHEKQVSCSIGLTNDTDYYCMAFRIANTSLLPFFIQQYRGIVAPRSRCTTTITLPAQEMARLKNHREGFIVVQSTKVDGSLTAVEITDDMFNEEGGNSQKKIDYGDKVVDEVNLTVRFDEILHEEHQKDLANLSAEMGSLETLSQEVQESMELSPHNDYEDSRHMEDLERILEGRMSPSRLPFSLLRYITADFSVERKIGSGASWEVYKGILGDKIIAVKRFSKIRTTDYRMFHRQIRTIMTVNKHKNIVRLLGYCSHTEEEAVEMEGKFIVAEIRERLLCYEYISNGSLDKYLTDELRGLEWHTRYQILLGICEGLQHLHMEKYIIHMDLKPSNILLGDHMVPKITDFDDISRLDEDTLTIIGLKPSDLRAYTAPEYEPNGKMSAKLDIYSLGVIIIELVTGNKETPNFSNVLRRWRHRWNKSAKYTPLWHQQVTKCLEVALRCMDKDPTQRPNIRDIIQELNEIDTCARNQSADQLTNSCLDDMLGIKPLELHVPVELNRQQSRSIQLTNDTDHYIAFMTISAEWSSLIYSVQPDKGVVPPGSMYSATITLQAQEEPVITGIARRKEGDITVMSTRVDGGVTAADISQDMFNNEDENKVVDKVSVTVIFDTP